MMRGAYSWAVAVRRPDGTIHTEEHDLSGASTRHAWLRKPVVRGCVALWESLSLSFKALEIAATHAFAEDPADTGSDETASQELTSRDMLLAMVGGVALAIGLFIVLPAVLTNLIVGSYGRDSFLWNIVDGILRVGAFVAYVWAISFMPDVKRMFAYHGAEHKTIHAHERGLPLDLESIRGFPTMHVRCGTAFMLMAMIVSILVFTLVPVRAAIDAVGVTAPLGVFALVVLSRIVLLPLVVGLSYEVTVKWAGSRADDPLVRVVLWPGLQLQKLTTSEPDDSMIEVAIAATRIVVDREDRERAAGIAAPETADVDVRTCIIEEPSIEPDAFHEDESAGQTR